MARKPTVALNELLVTLLSKVMDAESKGVITEEFRDITNNDMHIIEAIGVKEPKNMSAIAAKMYVTVGTLTVNMNSLEKKGYVVTLTEKGRKAFFHHRDYHKAMIHAAVRGLEEDEMQALMNCLNKLNAFFEEKQKENP